MTITQNSIKLDLGQIIAASGAGAIVLGSFLPWITVRSAFGTMGTNGVDGDGVITLALGLFLLLGSLLWIHQRRWPIILHVANFGAFAVAFVALMTAIGRISDAPSDFVHASVGAGLYVIFAGTVLVLVGINKAERVS